jgi:hypothetical protein
MRNKRMRIRTCAYTDKVRALVPVRELRRLLLLAVRRILVPFICGMFHYNETSSAALIYQLFPKKKKKSNQQRTLLYVYRETSQVRIVAV